MKAIAGERKTTIIITTHYIEEATQADAVSAFFLGQEDPTM